MKKILSLGTAAAVLSLTAIAASAAISPTIVGTPVEGEEVTVEILADGMTVAATEFTIEVSDNLTLVSYEPNPAGAFAVRADGTLAYAYASANIPADGTNLLTLVFTVDAAADDEITVKLVPQADYAAADIDGDVAAAVVVAGANDESDETWETEDDWGDTVDTYESIDNGGIDETIDDGGDAGEGDNKNPETGIALAVVPAALAGAAIVVAKKRK